ncbi:dnaJ homolog subfamily B member 9 isoform 1-T3 [Aulostomus maculatus]
MAVRGAPTWIQACVALLVCLSEAQHSFSETSRSYYDILRVEPTVTDSQIKKAFRKLAMKHHPDKNRSADAEQTFREIAEAYKVLSNKDSRRLYDTLGHEAFLKDAASLQPDDADDAGSQFSFSDLFGEFDDSAFVEDTHFLWSFPAGWEDEEGPYEYYSFESPTFSFHFGGENEEERCF